MSCHAVFRSLSTGFAGFSTLSSDHTPLAPIFYRPSVNEKSLWLYKLETNRKGATAPLDQQQNRDDDSHEQALQKFKPEPRTEVADSGLNHSSIVYKLDLHHETPAQMLPQLPHPL